MPLFMVKKEVFEWIRTGQKTIELTRGRTREGDKAVFQCGRNALRQDNYKNIIPSAQSLEEAVTYLIGLCGMAEGRFATFLKP